MKTLKQLASLVSGAEISGNADEAITALAHDSRKVQEGTLFICIPGVHVDGHSFIPQAVASGARAILTTRSDVAVPDGISVLRVPKLDAALQLLAPAFYDYPARSMRVIGITGTNGKTTTSYITRAILRKAGYKVGLIGTIQILIEEEKHEIHNTTPDVVELQSTIAEMRDRGMDYVVMEVSSHALAENRVAGIEFDTAVFTNRRITSTIIKRLKTIGLRRRDYLISSRGKAEKTARRQSPISTIRPRASCSRTPTVRI